MRPLWTVAEVVKATGGRPEGLSDGPISSISIDSREITPEALFVAIRGDTHDGHDFVGKAAAQGAAVAVIAEERLSALGRLTLPLVVVGDVLAALESLGRAARALRCC